VISLCDAAVEPALTSTHSFTGTGQVGPGPESLLSAVFSIEFE